MGKKKAAAVGVPIAVVLAVVGGLTLTLDFSSTTSDDDTTIINEASDLCPILNEVCFQDLVPDQYKNVCPLIDAMCG